MAAQDAMRRTRAPIYKPLPTRLYPIAKQPATAMHNADTSPHVQGMGTSATSKLALPEWLIRLELGEAAKCIFQRPSTTATAPLSQDARGLRQAKAIAIRVAFGKLANPSAALKVTTQGILCRLARTYAHL